MATELVTTQSRAPATVEAAPKVPWPFALETFLDTLNSPRTRTAYGRAVAEAMEALQVASPAEIEPPALAQYRAALVARLEEDRPDRLSPATVSLKLVALRQFLHFCRVTGLVRLSKDVISFVLKSPTATVQKPYQVLSAAERARLFEVAQRHGPRDVALLALALGCGLRVSELVAVKLGDLYQGDNGAWWVHVRMGKGRKDREVPLAPDVMVAVHGWLRAGNRTLRRKADRERYLFATRQSPRMTAERVRQIVKALVREAGIQKAISPHSCRHTMAIELLRLGASPVVVQKILGHASLATTQRYVDHLERADLAQWAFSPL